MDCRFLDPTLNTLFNVLQLWHVSKTSYSSSSFPEATNVCSLQTLHFDFYAREFFGAAQIFASRCRDRSMRRNSRSTNKRSGCCELLKHLVILRWQTRFGGIFRKLVGPDHGPSPEWFLGPCYCKYIWMFPKIGVPQNGWFIMENPVRMDDWGYHYFWKDPYIYTYIYIYFVLLLRYLELMNVSCRMQCEPWVRSVGQASKAFVKHN